jgi:hypothetical protein
MDKYHGVMRPLIVQAQTQKAATHYHEILIGTTSLKDTAKHMVILYTHINILNLIDNNVFNIWSDSLHPGQG